jgi:serine protease Do
MCCVPARRPFARRRREAAVHPGDPVLAVGNPLGIGTSLSSGIVSGIGRNLMKTPFDDYVQTDAAINHGNSGGPLIDTNGLVVGVDTILLTNQPNEGSNGLGFAISSSVVGYVVHHLIDPDAAPVGWIGVQLQDLSLGLANAFGMLSPGGFLISGVENDSSAQEAGLHAGDVILRFGDAADQPDNSRALMRAIAKAPTGKAVTLTVWRDGQTLQVPVTVRAGPHLMEPHGSMGPAEDAVLPLPSDDLGLLLAPISLSARK